MGSGACCPSCVCWVGRPLLLRVRLRLPAPASVCLGVLPLHTSSPTSTLRMPRLLPLSTVRTFSLSCDLFFPLYCYSGKKPWLLSKLLLSGLLVGLEVPTVLATILVTVQLVCPDQAKLPLLLNSRPLELSVILSFDLFLVYVRSQTFRTTKK